MASVGPLGTRQVTSAVPGRRWSQHHGLRPLQFTRGVCPSPFCRLRPSASPLFLAAPGKSPLLDTSPHVLPSAPPGKNVWGHVPSEHVRPPTLPSGWQGALTKQRSPHGNNLSGT